METPKEYYYTYYSYEEWGRGYIGSRGCKCLPEEDIKYFGSSKDKTFKPTHKIILKDDYATREEAYADEIILQKYYKVVENQHFANRSYQTTTKFCLSREQAIKNGKKSSQKNKSNNVGLFAQTKEKRSELGKIGGKIGGKKTYELGLGIHNQSKKELLDNCSAGGKTAYKLGLGVHSMTLEQKVESGKKGGNKVKELGIGIFSLSEEERKKNSSKGGKKTKEQNIGLFSLTKEDLVKNGKKTTSQKWKCLETGFVTTPLALSNYQKARGIDTTKRVRIE